MSYQRHLIANEIALLSANEMSYQRHLIANENTPVSIVIGTAALMPVPSPDEQQRENDTQKTTTTTTKTNKQKTTKQHTHTHFVYFTCLESPITDHPLWLVH